MLTEYAITPQIFDWSHNSSKPEWPSMLRSFWARLFAEGRHGTVISDLYDGSWYATEFHQSLVSARKNRSVVAPLLAEITKKLEHCKVLRPSVNTVYPQTETDWVHEARQHSGTSPICRIVASSPGFEVDNFFSLDEPFWAENQKTKLLLPDMQLQIREMARLLRFSTAIGFVCPFFSDGLEAKTHNCIPHGECFFPIEIIKKKISLYNTIANLRRVDLHVKENRSYDKLLLAKEIDNFLCSQIPDLDHVFVNIFFRGKVTDRRIMFGDLKNSDFKLRWVISSSHFPKRTDDTRPIPGADSDPQVLALLNKKDTSTCYSRYYSRSPDYSRASR